MIRRLKNELKSSGKPVREEIQDNVLLSKYRAF
jgi:hypothetical protein